MNDRSDSHKPLKQDLVSSECVFIVIAAYNEEPVVGETIQQLQKEWQHIVVVDDCSNDGTASEATRAGAAVIRHPVNLGQGAALQTGIEYALRQRAKYIVTFDADGQHDASDIQSMLHALVNSDAEIALGSRFLGRTTGLSRSRRVLLKTAILFTRIMTGAHFTDAHNGFLNHPSYRLLERFNLRGTGMHAVEARTHEELQACIGEADVLLVSGMLWRGEYLARAGRLAFLQSISAGMDQYDKAAFQARDIKLTSAQGTNANSVAEHALALMLAMNRQLHLARDNQRARLWRDPISDLGKRENELAGKTLMVVGFGRIGQRVAALAKAFGMSVIAVKRDLTQGTDMADKVVSQDRVVEMAAISDFIVLTCPLNASTENLIDEHVFRAMRPTAFLVNVARGKVVHEPALLQALRERRIAGAALDCVWEEPLPADSPLWELDNALITPHVGGETARFEDALLDVFLENLDRLYAGRSDLINLVT